MSDAPNGMFRGKEFPKALILAGLMLVGWPAVIYFGFFKKAAEKPVNAPIVTLPKMPPPDTSPEFRAVIDKEGRGVRDEAAIALLLKRVRENPDKLATEARREVLPIDLLTTPWKYRGLPIRMEGFAQQVYAHDGEDKELAPNGRFYELWFRSDQNRQGMYPCCVFVENVPATLPGGRNIEERVALEGYFLKLYKYRAGDTWRFAPLLIGRIAHIPNVEPPSRRFDLKVWIPALFVMLFVYISIRAFFAIRKTRVKPPTGLGRASDPLPADQLHEWLAKPDVEDPVELDPLDEEG